MVGDGARDDAEGIEMTFPQRVAQGVLPDHPLRLPDSKPSEGRSLRFNSRATKVGTRPKPPTATDRRIRLPGEAAALPTEIP